MLKIILALAIFALLSGCATEARISEYQMCASQGKEKFPINSVPQNYMETEYYQRQEGMTCIGTNNVLHCEPNMRTYQRQVQKTRYVDANAGSRNSWIEQCANQQCIRKFGNSDCDKKQNTIPLSKKNDINSMADLMHECRAIGNNYGSKEMQKCIANNKEIFLKK